MTAPMAQIAYFNDHCALQSLFRGIMMICLPVAKRYLKMGI